MAAKKKEYTPVEIGQWVKSTANEDAFHKGFLGLIVDIEPYDEDEGPDEKDMYRIIFNGEDGSDDYEYRTRDTFEPVAEPQFVVVWSDHCNDPLFLRETLEDAEKVVARKKLEYKADKQLLNIGIYKLVKGSNSFNHNKRK